MQLSTLNPKLACERHWANSYLLKQLGRALDLSKTLQILAIVLALCIFCCDAFFCRIAIGMNISAESLRTA